MPTATRFSPVVDELAGYLERLGAQERIAATLRVLMRVQGLSQAEVARSLGLERSLLSNRLRGRSRWTSDDLDGIARVFDLPLADLFGGHLLDLVENGGPARHEALAVTAAFAAATPGRGLPTGPYGGSLPTSAYGAAAGDRVPFEGSSTDRSSGWVLAA